MGMEFIYYPQRSISRPHVCTCTLARTFEHARLLDSDETAQ